MPIVALLLFITTQQGQPELPDGPGKATVQKICTSCHTLAVVVSQRRTRPAWQKVADDMTARGMNAEDQEVDAAVGYFTRFFGKINVNRGSAEEISTVLDLPAKDAAAIVKYREENGDFKTLDDLAKVPGLDAKKVESRKDRILLR